jgi:hypothetical protein
MYAPKFRSWMSNWDRFDEALEARLQTQGDEIMTDVRRQIAEAMPKEPEPAYNPYLNDLLRAVRQQQGSFNAYNRGGFLGNTLGGGLGDWLNELARPGSITRI